MNASWMIIPAGNKVSNQNQIKNDIGILFPIFLCIDKQEPE